MPSEDVEVILSADDRMTPAVDKATDNIDAKIKRIKEVGGRAKASTEFIGTLANTLGGSELAGYAGQLAGLTEKVSAFSEVSKVGAQGSRLFAVGLSAGVAVAAIKAGFELNKYANGMNEVAKQLDKTIERNDALNKSLLQTASQRFSFEMQELDLIGDPQEQERKVTELIIGIEKQIEDARKRLEKKQPQESFDEAWFGDPATRAKVKERFEQDQEAIRDQIDQLREQADTLRESVNPRAKEIEQLKQAAELKKKNEDFLGGLERELELLRAKSDVERAAIQARQQIANDSQTEAKVRSLLEEKLAIEAAKEAEKLAQSERQKAQAEAEADAKRLADLKESELAKLKEQRILLLEGKQAAKQFALEQQGLDKATAARIASEQEMLDQVNKKAEKTPDLIAQESRLLTRGKVDNTDKQQLKKQEEMAKSLRIIEENSKRWKSDTDLAYEKIGI